MCFSEEIFAADVRGCLQEAWGARVHGAAAKLRTLFFLLEISD